VEVEELSKVQLPLASAGLEAEVLVVVPLVVELQVELSTPVVAAEAQVEMDQLVTAVLALLSFHIHHRMMI
jgi:hypothetical protein